LTDSSRPIPAIAQIQSRAWRLLRSCHRRHV